mgnify:CR=1 FL=1
MEGTSVSKNADTHKSAYPGYVYGKGSLGIHKNFDQRIRATHSVSQVYKTYFWSKIFIILQFFEKFFTSYINEYE